MVRLGHSFRLLPLQSTFHTCVVCIFYKLADLLVLGKDMGRFGFLSPNDPLVLVITDMCLSYSVFVVNIIEINLLLLYPMDVCFTVQKFQFM